ncbi:hypothetical protein BDV34DRAFT_185661 [Aspergillus parasiticus]|uniref:Uncharacterized protein n=1 Tax=Aspergillus parasiticus TaxID=5067 RepID=A0A5N6E1R5_ASPPA|nr:hypothetical protein BDV34DRAFT_185661 [Aspergillus parasiticus]
MTIRTFQYRRMPGVNQHTVLMLSVSFKLSLSLEVVFSTPLFLFLLHLRTSDWTADFSWEI